MAKKQDIGAEIVQALSNYTDDVMEQIEEEADRIAKEAVDELKKTSPVQTGDYAKGWAKKKDGKNIVIYNRQKPGLTHLLEKGHALRGGGRTKAYPHIAPVEEKVNIRFELAVENAIEEGG